ncbi:MAG TPA: DUF5668 domain-containing protein [Steroidobacteraceae bacterium]|jgi:uncharacterized membrane protein HdeD (DUF308 family)|nr:DUF5668 domain-containing protein [Steroidobacteraceae bacterium]
MVIDDTPRRYRRERRGHQRNPVGILIAGAALAIYGVALLLDNLGLGEARNYAYRAWPAMLVLAGITLLIHRDANREGYGFWGTVSLFAGAWLYVSQQHWIHVPFWSLAGPTVLVLIGGTFVYRALQRYDADRQIVLRR